MKGRNFLQEWNRERKDGRKEGETRSESRKARCTE